MLTDKIFCQRITLPPTQTCPLALHRAGKPTCPEHPPNVFRRPRRSQGLPQPGHKYIHIPCRDTYPLFVPFPSESSLSRRFLVDFFKAFRDMIRNDEQRSISFSRFGAFRHTCNHPSRQAQEYLAEVRNARVRYLAGLRYWTESQYVSANTAANAIVTQR